MFYLSRELPREGSYLDADINSAERHYDLCSKAPHSFFVSFSVSSDSLISTIPKS
jgi:hypothetical protein